MCHYVLQIVQQTVSKWAVFKSLRHSIALATDGYFGTPSSWMMRILYHGKCLARHNKQSTIKQPSTIINQWILIFGPTWLVWSNLAGISGITMSNQEWYPLGMCYAANIWPSPQLKTVNHHAYHLFQWAMTSSSQSASHSQSWTITPSNYIYK